MIDDDGGVTEQDGAADETRSSLDEIFTRTSTTEEETSTSSWRAVDEQKKKVLDELRQLEIDVSLSRKETAQRGQYSTQLI